MTSISNLQRSWLLAGMVIVAIIIALQDSFAAMLHLWIGYDTYNHCLLIAPVSLWLIWRQRDVLMSIEPSWSLSGLAATALVTGLWALGAIATVESVQHFAAVGLIPLSLWAILGTRVATAMLFPLVYLLFQVPFGEFLIPPLMDFTADMTVVGVRLSGVAVYHDGLYFEIPNGSFKIIEACSGIRMLIAAVAVGTLLAYLNFDSWRRRTFFIAGVVMLAIVANWIRAYVVVMVGHFFGMDLVARHVWLGYVVFAIVIIIMIWLASRFTDIDARAEAEKSAVRIESAAAGINGPMLIAACAVLGIVFSAPMLASTISRNAGQEIHKPIAALPAGDNRWSGPGPLSDDWSPRFHGDTTTLAGRYDGADASVDIVIISYRTLSPQSELINDANRIFSPGRWTKIGETRGVADSIMDEPLAYIETEIRGPTGVGRLVRHWYVVGDQSYRNRVAIKLIELRNTLIGRPTPAGVIAVSTQFGADPRQATRVLDEFMATALR